MDYTEEHTSYAQTVFNEAAQRHPVSQMAENIGLDLVAIPSTTDSAQSNDLDDLLNNVGKAPSSTSIVTVPSAPKDGANQERRNTSHGHDALDRDFVARTGRCGARERISAPIV